MRVALCVLLLAGAASAAEPIRVTGGPTDQANVVVTAPASGGETWYALPGGKIVPSQRSAAPLVTGGKPTPADAKPVVTLVVPKLLANAMLELKPDGELVDFVQFRFAEPKPNQFELLYGDRPVTRFMAAKHDASTKEGHELTFKPFHHVYDPEDGKALLTAGEYLLSDKSKLYAHHRGLFFGWNKITYGANQADIWHGTNGVYSQIEKVLSQEAGPVFGRQRVLIHWYGKDGLLFAEETREVTAYSAAGGTLIEFASVVSTKLPKVVLDGDPQHAGLHFRAAQDVAKSHAKETVYLRPDGVGKPGETRNWPAQKEHVNLPWLGMSFVTGDQRYTAVYLDRPDNPKEARFSERDYGRFGSYFRYEVTPKTPLAVQYRVWVQRGQPTVAECAALAAGFR